VFLDFEENQVSFQMRNKMPCHVAIILGIATSAAYGQHTGDVFVGRSAAGQLKASPVGSGGYIPDQNIKLLPPVSGLFNGWSDNNPGFDHIVTDQPDLDFYVLQSGTSVRLQVVQVDPAFQAISPSFVVIDDPGESMLLGTNTLHNHPTYLINSDQAQFDPEKVLWRATFKLVDTGSTAYSPSDNFTFYFATVDCNRGDCNGDTLVNGGDIPGFIATVLDPSGGSPEQRCQADTNRDGYATMEDIPSFVQQLLSS
jgi:hypothetical protein